MMFLYDLGKFLNELISFFIINDDLIIVEIIWLIILIIYCIFLLKSNKKCKKINKIYDALVKIEEEEE